MTLETPRLLLRPFAGEDAPAIFALARDPEIGPRSGWKPFASELEARIVLRGELMNDRTWAITDRSDGTLLGAAGIHNCSAMPGEPEFGCWIGRAYWGRGYMPEAAAALLRMLFDGGERRVWCAHYGKNGQSRRAIGKAGFLPVLVRVEFNALGARNLVYYYSLRREEFFSKFGETP